MAKDGARIDNGTIATDTVSAAIAGDVSLADGSLSLDVNAELLSALLPEAARQYLAEKVSVTATVNRDAAGTIRLEPFTAKSRALDVAGSVAYRPDAFDVRLKGNFADISKLSADIAGPIGFDVSATGSPATPDMSATISSEKLIAVGREITGLALMASGKVDTANPAAKVSVKGNVAGEALTGEAVLATSGGQRRIDGLSLASATTKSQAVSCSTRRWCPRARSISFYPTSVRWRRSRVNRPRVKSPARSVFEG